MKMKKTATGTAGAILAILFALLGAYLDSDIAEIKEAISVPYTGDMAALRVVLAGYGDNAVVAVAMASDGIEIPRSDAIRLEGGMNSAWDDGDILVLFKKDGVWVEIGRRLVY